MSTIRVLVVEDSLTIRKRLVEVLAGDPALEVAGEAEDGKRAIELCRSLRPDVITMDMMMPVMTGLAATEYIMSYCPTPILIVSASKNRGELFRTYDALAAGALDVLEKPSGDETDGSWERLFVATVKLISRIKVITHPRARLGLSGGSKPAAMPESAFENPENCRLIAIGASTGGPAALVDILRNLPPDFQIPILLVIHIGRPFADSFAEWLDGQSPLRVSYARDGEPLPQKGAGKVILAPPDRHLVVAQGELHLTSDPERHSCRPSVDVLFESVALEFGPRSTACLLTGMGRDGAEGLLAIRRQGGLTIVQDEGTCVVFGMPREAILLEAAERTLPLDQIAPSLAALAAGQSSRRRI
ncbi:MAG: chemotaxis-specific protein-glutamate methyltransferase CheB [Planctomycetes bacterium]|nr:chemotaxis-specific protein-glutamate methyltransferase CheB [Planctomycetota bacterium]